MIDTATTMLDWFGVIVFAITGSLVASRKQMDVVGFAMLGVATGIGGGTLRDMLLGSLPVFWVQQPAYLATCVFVSVLVFFTAHIPQSRYRFLLWLDAIGLATFAATGAQKAADAGANLAVAVVMGVITATFGGIIRDLLGGESPIILRREIYVSAALAGAATFACLVALDVERQIALVTALAIALSIRGAALHYGWSLPRYRPRPGSDCSRE